jgi:cytochrome b561
MDPLAQPRA